MSEQPSSSEGMASKQAIQAQTTMVNQLLQELETMLDDNQHAVVTELFTEKAVLAAMRARAALDEQAKTVAQPTTGQATERLVKPTVEAIPDATSQSDPKGESAI